MTRTLQFAVGFDRPTAPEVTVYDRTTATVAGTEFVLRVIGSSHYVDAPAYGFHEMASCTPVEGARVLDLSTDVAETVRFGSDRLAGRTTVAGEPLASFPADRSFDLRYAFEADAVTAIAVREDGYETYHTYPELDLSLRTETTFESVGEPVGGDQSRVE